MANHSDQLSVHKVDGKFYAFKRMIGGTRFYFGREFGIMHEGASQAKRANIAASVYMQEWARLKASGQSWTPAAKVRAKEVARHVLGMNCTDATTPTMSDPESAKSTGTITASAPSAPVLRLHDAMDAYLARVRDRADSGQLSVGRADTIKFAILRAKSFMIDLPMSAVDVDRCREFVNYFASRPITVRRNKPMAPDTVIDTITATRAFFADAADRGDWTAPASLDKCFGFKRDKLLTEDELDARASVKTFSVEELTTVWRFTHHSRRQLYLLLGLNCGFSQRDISTLRKSHCFLDGNKPYIKRRRAKTKVMGKWRLWPETAYLLKKHMNTEAAEPHALLDPRKPRTLVGLNARSRYDVIRNEWDHVITDAVAGHVNFPLKTVKVPELSFKFLRKTGSNMLRHIAGRDVAETYLAHTDRTMGKVYHNPDYVRLAHALRKLRQRLQPMFNAAVTVLPVPESIV